jgi:hypothetical protein
VIDKTRKLTFNIGQDIKVKGRLCLVNKPENADSAL